MRAVVCHAGELTVRDLPTPVPGPGEVLLRVTRAGICGSDLHARVHCDVSADVSEEVGYPGFMRREHSVVFGHEFAGEVISYGPDCKKRWGPGTLVVAVPMVSHGGERHLTGFSESAPGAYADFVVVAEDMTFEVPEGVSAEHAALTEPMAVAYHAVRRGAVGKRDVAVVIGCGPIGLAVIAVLKASGVKHVVASDLSESRRKLAQRVGADVVVDPRVDSPWDAACERGRYITRAPDMLGVAFDAMHRLRRLPVVPWRPVFQAAERLGAVPGGPVVFECVGAPGMIENIITGAPFRSRIVVVGVCMEPDSYRPVMAINKEHDFRFAFYYDPAEYHTALQMIADGRIDVSPLITATIGFDSVPAAFEALGSAEQHAKILIDPTSDAVL
ncbi:zinc-binding dehydrogenase [Gordonia pseudamarae]|uniref:Zinc-binding dehydrogenase n=1 Tax=Gordonia pseudamarae TaxID=2831662 RepID=A0ABX6IN40_9ACTN|nr:MULTISPECIES: zinc-binding dehydrogenase [Gordonia]MBD0020675.1 zinc-binding dehydrogenase [Gordonia sp. (in: high G+C Gram-positive bacteria)]QHN27716.1 zinc-binding dehydrogenase [Gordonia pseudamarae]QHN36598.1 zinc-binding dehydrogenase [Gordonia pseudamarae]